MHNGASGSKRKTAAPETAVPAKCSHSVLVPEEMLRTMASSLNAASLDLMALATTDVAARGRVVAVMAKWERQLNIVLGLKRRDVSVLAISDVIIDVFQCLRRQELDTLQIVSRRFSAIIERKLTLVCLRRLVCAKLSRCSAENQFVLLMNEVGSTKMTRFPTGVDDEAAAAALLLDACQSSSVGSIELIGTTPMDADFFDSLALSAPTIFVGEFCMGRRALSDGIPHDRVLQALQTFAELSRVKSYARKDANVHVCLVRTCFKVGVDLRSDEIVLSKKYDTAVVEDALLEFCFGACDEQYAERDRFLCVKFSKSLKTDFLQRWIEKAEVIDCRHKLTLSVSVSQGTMPQDTAALDAYKQNHHVQRETRFGSVSGRRWTATCIDYWHGIGINRIIFAINH